MNKGSKVGICIVTGVGYIVLHDILNRLIEDSSNAYIDQLRVKGAHLVNLLEKIQYDVTEDELEAYKSRIANVYVMWGDHVDKSNESKVWFVTHMIARNRQHKRMLKKTLAELDIIENELNEKIDELAKRD